MQELACLLYAVAGTCVACVAACLPGLHVYNVAALILLVMRAQTAGGMPEPWLMFFVGMVVGYAMASGIPAILISAPDDSSAWIVSPGHSYLLQGRGYEALVLTVIGCLGGLWALIALAPLAGRVTSMLLNVLQPHLHWIVGALVMFVLLSEWPKDPEHGSAPFARLLVAWVPLVAGLATFALSGLLGLVLSYRPIVPRAMSFQGLVPAFVGLFAVPWLVQNLIAGGHIPRQHIPRSVDADLSLALGGVAAGSMGGLVATYLPAVTGSLGGLIAGHATAQRDERAFLVAQGATKVVYYVGALLLFLAPGPPLTRGGMASMLAPVYTPRSERTYWLSIAAMAICGATASLLTLALGRSASKLVASRSLRWLSVAALVMLIGTIGGLTGERGLLVMLAASGIGLIPPSFGSRRANCLGILLLPMLLDAAGVAPAVVGWLGLG
ncbi:MAG: tripartite tricarboxylate transporter permease [Anaerolineae bacterium]